MARPSILDEIDAVELAKQFAEMPRLNKRQQKFVDAYLISNSPYEAVIKAGYSKRSAYQRAHKLLTDPKVSRAIELQQKALRLRNNLTQDYFVEHLKKIIESRWTHNNEKISALSLLARITGFIKEKPPESKQLVIFKQEGLDQPVKVEEVQPSAFIEELPAQNKPANKKD